MNECEQSRVETADVWGFGGGLEPKGASANIPSAAKAASIALLNGGTEVPPLQSGYFAAGDFVASVVSQKFAAYLISQGLVARPTKSGFLRCATE
jgi:hypothetical protein